MRGPRPDGSATAPYSQVTDEYSERRKDGGAGIECSVEDKRAAGGSGLGQCGYVPVCSMATTSGPPNWWIRTDRDRQTTSITMSTDIVRRSSMQALSMSVNLEMLFPYGVDGSQLWA